MSIALISSPLFSPEVKASPFVVISKSGKTTSSSKAIRSAVLIALWKLGLFISELMLLTSVLPSLFLKINCSFKSTCLGIISGVAFGLNCNWKSSNGTSCLKALWYKGAASLFLVFIKELRVSKYDASGPKAFIKSEFNLPNLPSILASKKSFASFAPLYGNTLTSSKRPALVVLTSASVNWLFWFMALWAKSRASSTEPASASIAFTIICKAASSPFSAEG